MHDGVSIVLYRSFLYFYDLACNYYVCVYM